jgi:magnesium transporter
MNSLGDALKSAASGIVDRIVAHLPSLNGALLLIIAGAMVPIIMRRMGQDPATASSIFLTTVTDVTGFLSFLGIATLMSGMLTAA